MDRRTVMFSVSSAFFQTTSKSFAISQIRLVSWCMAAPEWVREWRYERDVRVGSSGSYTHACMHPRMGLIPCETMKKPCEDPASQHTQRKIPRYFLAFQLGLSNAAGNLRTTQTSRRASKSNTLFYCSDSMEKNIVLCIKYEEIGGPSFFIILVP